MSELRVRNNEQIQSREVAGNTLNLLTVSHSHLLTDKQNSSSVAFRTGVAEISGAISAGIAGTVSWSVVDRVLAHNRYGLAANIVAGCVTGGLTRFAVRGGLERALLNEADRRTAIADLRLGAVDAMAAVLAFKVENAFSNSWKRDLARRAELGVSNELLVEQGAKILEGSVGKRIVHNGLRGMVGGSAAAFAMSIPHAIEHHGRELTSIDGLRKAGRDILYSTATGTVFGGVLGFGGTAVWNAGELGGYAKTAVFGRGDRFALDVQHFNDGHSALLGEGSTLSRLATRSDQLSQASAAAGRPSIVLDMGDSHSGTIVDVATEGGQLEGHLLHRVMKVTAAVPGNHAPDMGRPVSPSVEQWVSNVRQLASTGEFRGVAANIELPLCPEFTNTIGVAAPPYQPYRIIEPLKGEKVALVGLVTDELEAATQALVDSDFIALRGRLGGRTWTEVMSDKSNKLLPEDDRALLDRLITKKGFRDLNSNDPRTVSEIVDQLFETQLRHHKSAEAVQLHRQLIELAKQHPDSPLSEVIIHHPDDTRLKELSRLFPSKRITDLHEVTVREPEAVLRATIDELSSQGVNKVIVMSHLGKSLDRKLASRVRGVSAILGGHSHDLEPVPLWIRNSITGKDVVVSQAGSGYKWLGEMNLVFNTDGSVNRYLSGGRLHHIHGKIIAHPDMEDAIQEFLNKKPEGREILGKVALKLPTALPVELSLDGIRGASATQTPLANVIVYAAKEEGQKWLRSQPESVRTIFGERVQAVLMHSGGIRSGVQKGTIQLLEIENIPLNNLCMARMSGDNIRQAVNFGVHDFPEARTCTSRLFSAAKELLSSRAARVAGEAAPSRLTRAAEIFRTEPHDPSGNFVLAGNLRYTIDRSLPPHQRVTKVLIRHDDGVWMPLENNEIYTVLTETHPVEKWGKIPMINSDCKKTASFDTLVDPTVWVHQSMIGDSRTALGNFSAIPLPKTSTRDALIAFLEKPGLASDLIGMHDPSSAFGQSPITDLSPGTWRPSVYPGLCGVLVPPLVERIADRSGSFDRVRRELRRCG